MERSESDFGAFVDLYYEVGEVEESRLSASVPGLTASLARASEKSREAFSESENEAQAWLEETRSGARSQDKECVTCGRGPPLEDNHLAGKRHGDLTVPMCLADHRRFTAGQRLWDPRYHSSERTAELDESLLPGVSMTCCYSVARHAPDSTALAYLSLADSLREQYTLAAGRSV